MRRAMQAGALSVFWLVCSLDCVSVTHGAAVSPGWRAAATVEERAERYAVPHNSELYDTESAGGESPPATLRGRGTVRSVQVEAGHGWAWERMGLFVNGIFRAEGVKVSEPRGEADNGDSAAPLLEVYWQFLKGPFDMGTGAICGWPPWPSAFVEMGGALTSSTRLDGGVLVDIETEKMFVMATQSIVGIASVGFQIAQTHVRGEALKRCDESCTIASYMSSATSGSLILSVP